MSDTTTIEITDEQKAKLDEMKEHDKVPYKGVLQRLIGSNSDSIGSSGTDIDYEKLAEARQEQLEEVISAYCSDTATEEHIGELADLIKKLQQAIETLDVSVDVEQSDSGMDENDVRNIVERELEKTFGDRLPQ